MHAHRETWIVTFILDRYQELTSLSVQLAMIFFLSCDTTAGIFKSEKDETT